MRLVRFLSLLIGGLNPYLLLSNTLVIESSFEQNIEMDVDLETRFGDVIDQVYSYLRSQNEECICPNENEELEPKCIRMQWSFEPSVGRISILAKQGDNIGRDYGVIPTKSEKEDIAKIVKILAYDSLWSIGNQKSSLKKMGDRVDHLHPFRFLVTVFSNEESKAGIAAIKNQIGWVRDGFFDPLLSSLKAEGERQNLIPYLDDFAKNIKIDSAQLIPLLKKGKYKEFVDFLIESVPRANNPNRYNM